MLSNFYYKATDEKGSIVEGNVKAEGIQGAFSEVKALRLFPIKIVPLSNKENFDFKGALNELKNKKKLLSYDYKSSVFFILSIVLALIFVFISILPFDNRILLISQYVVFVFGILNLAYFFGWIGD